MQLKQIEKSVPGDQFVKTSQRAKAKHQKHADKTEYRDCKYCGKSHKRGSKFCSAYGKRCSKCNKLYHFASVCQSRTSRKQPTNFCENESGHSDSIHDRTHIKLDLSHRRTDANCIHQKKTHQSHSNIA